MKDKIIEFRAVLDEIDWSKMPIGFNGFPRGTCGDISDILAEYLYSIGFSNITYVCGERNGGSHAWLEISGLAIDITADQFDDVNEPVLIQNPKIWHGQFSDQERRRAGYKHMHGPAIDGIERVHGEIMKYYSSKGNPCP